MAIRSFNGAFAVIIKESGRVIRVFNSIDEAMNFILEQKKS